ncbi:Transcriptional regulator TACO1-like protein [Corchorus olitorius]|uniref:Transcriptional regulator TACO1-like protein n=1 Tax=Corchorus olitorius TaxID=93759 RepID=A0A1R3IVR8_9ROSI|nr:Transcriptional regulator TACO1-like protein [Corchorus olitorius]
MSTLGDDELSLVLNWVHDRNDRKSVSQVCKQWLRVEGLTRISIRVLEPDLIPVFMPRFPNLLSFETPMFISDSLLEFVAKTCPKLQFVNLNLRKTREDFDEVDGISGSEDVGNDGICALANGCPNLSKVLLRKRKNVGNVAVISLVKFLVNLTTLDLGRCDLVDDQAIEAIGCSNSIRNLNLEACSLITDHGLGILATGEISKTLKKLVLAECDRITDSGVSMLNQIQCLEELNLAECGPKITDSGGMAVSSITSLRKLNLAWLINLSDATVIAIAENCVNLVAIDLTGCELVTGAGVRAFGNHEYLEYLVLASCYNICMDDLDMVLRCRSLKDIVLDKGLRMWIPMAMQLNISRFTNGVPSNSLIVSRNGIFKSSRKFLSSASSISLSSSMLYQVNSSSNERQLRSISTFPPLCMGRRSCKIADRKGAQNAKKAKLFSRIGKEVVSAVKKGGPNPISNTVLAAVLEKARELDVPKDILERNIKRASEKGQEAYIEKIYEVYGYGGVSIVVEVSTDKITRSFAAVREVVKDYGGKIADPGSVMFKFRRVRVANIKVTDADKDQLLTIALDAGAEDVIEPPTYEDDTDEDRLESYYKIVSSGENYETILSKLRDEGIIFETDNGSELLPLTTIEVDDEAMDLNKELMSKLLELDDVNAVYTDQK